MTSTPAPDLAACALADLTQHIRDTHHAYLRRELPAITDLLREGIAAATSADAAGLRLFGRTFLQFRSALENHLRKEEEVLFPFIERLERAIGAGAPPPRHAFGSLALPIDVLEAEHELGDRLLDRMRPTWQQWTPAPDAPAWQLALHGRLLRLDGDMQQHVHVEDAVLFPRTIQMEGRPWPSPAGSR